MPGACFTNERASGLPPVPDDSLSKLREGRQRGPEQLVVPVCFTGQAILDLTEGPLTECKPIVAPCLPCLTCKSSGADRPGWGPARSRAGLIL